MPRQARVVAVAVPHHITHRGNNRQDVFLSDEDRRRYQNLLREQLEPCGVELLGWCWMTNHVHLVAIPHRQDSFARLIMRVHSRHAQDMNRRYSRCGHVWQSRYYCCALGPDHLQTALLYADLNPVRAGLVGDAMRYPWSSASAHAGGKDQGGLLTDSAIRRLEAPGDWEERLRASLDDELIVRLQRATMRGAALGDSAFVANLEERYGRKLNLRPRGRPPKALAKGAGEV